jgi:hypothetical protein
MSKSEDAWIPACVISFLPIDVPDLISLLRRQLPPGEALGDRIPASAAMTRPIAACYREHILSSLSNTNKDNNRHKPEEAAVKA